MDYVVLAIVEAERVPCRMLVHGSRIEILVGVASQVAETLHLIFHGVGVDDIHDDGDALLVGRINEFLEFFGSSESAGGSEEGAHMIAEGAIVRMLLNGHNLDAVVAVLDDARQHIVFELAVGAHFLGVLSHSDVALVDEERVGIGFEFCFLPHIRFLRVPHLCGEDFCLLVLHHSAHPCRYALTVSTVPVDVHFVEVAMLDGLFGEFQFPVVGARDTFGSVALLFGPVVEIAYEIDVRSVGRPLAEHPSTCHFVQAVVEVSRCEVAESRLAVVGELSDFPEGMVMPSADSRFKRFQVGVVGHEPYVFYLFGFFVFTHFGCFYSFLYFFIFHDLLWSFFSISL